MGKDEVLTNELGLKLVVESANDLDLSLFTFCRNFGSLSEECEVDGDGISSRDQVSCRKSWVPCPVQ